MAQIIKHRRGTLESLSAVTGSLQKGEIVIASGSSNLSTTNGTSIVFAVPNDGQVQAVNRFLIGNSAPATFAGSTYNGMVNGVPFYDSGSGTLYLLGSDGNTAINLVGNIQPFSSSVATSINALSASIGSGTIGTSVTLLNTFSASVLTQLSTIGTVTASYDARFTQIGVVSGSLISSASVAAIANANQNTFTASAETRFTQIGVVSGSLIATASNHEGRLNAIEAVSGTFARTNSSNVFNGTQIITGSVYITQDLVVYGSSSIQNVSASNVYFGDNIITLNAVSPALRFAGIEVFDSGSSGVSGSLLWDSVNNRWLYAQSGSGEGYNSAILINGPQNSGSLGSEQTLTANYIPVAQGSDHIRNSKIWTDGTNTSIGTNVVITGSIVASGTTLVSGSSQIDVTATTNFTSFSGSVSASIAAVVANVGSGVGVSITNLNSFTSSQLTQNSTLATYTSSAETRFTEIGIVSGSLIASASAAKSKNDSQDVSIAALNSFSSSQLTQSFALASYTSSVETRLTEIGVVSGSLILSASAAKTKNDSQDVSISNLNSTTASLNTSVSNINSFTSSAASRLTTLEGSGTIQGLGTGNNVTFAKVTTTGDVIVGGDLVVQGNTTTLNTAQLVVEDKLITLASGSTSNATADGAGFEIAGTSAYFKYDGTNNYFSSSIAIVSNVTGSVNVPGYGSSKRLAFRNAAGNLDFVAAPSASGEIPQWNGTDFVMSNVIDGGSF